MLRISLRTYVTALCALIIISGSAFAQTLPSGWATTDIGAVGAAGSASAVNGNFTVTGAGADVWGSADAFRFAYTTLTGDGSIVARVASVQNVNAWTKAGVMMRETLTAGSRHVFMLVSPGKGLAFQRRTSTGALSTHTSGGAGTAPRYVRLTRAGNVFSAHTSSDGSTWSLVGSNTIAMSSTIYVGLAVGSHVYGTLATATFTSPVVTTASSSTQSAPAPSTTGSATATVPAGWATTDVGSVGAAGSASGADGSFTLRGAGADVWGTADAFRFAYTPLTGDGSIVTRVVGVDNINAWTKAGVMMRETLSAGSRHAFMLISPAKGLAFQRRTAAGGTSTHTSGGAGTAPYFLRLTRTGSTFTAHRSLDGAAWTLVGSDTIPMTSTIYVGVAVSSHVQGVLATANFASTAVTTTVSAPPPPPPAVTSQTTLRVLSWNTHHGGIGTDGRYDPNRIASWIVQMNPDVAVLNEVDTQDQVNAIVNGLRARTGATWYTSFSGRGNLVVSRLALSATSRCRYPSDDRYSAHLGVLVNNRPVHVWSTHLTVNSATARLNEINGLKTCAASWPEARILAGDFNMQAGSTEYQAAASTYTDAWVAARTLGTTTNYSGNCDGCTRNSRIDYVFSSRGATFLTVQSARIFDTRDANGVMPSDHKPLLVTYTVR